MTTVPQATTRSECIEEWKHRKRIPVPSRNGRILDLLIVSMEEGAGDTLVVGAHAIHTDPVKRFCVVPRGR